MDVFVENPFSHTDEFVFNGVVVQSCHSAEAHGLENKQIYLLIFPNCSTYFSIKMCHGHTCKKGLLLRRRLSGQKKMRKIWPKTVLKSPKIAKILPKNGLKLPKIAFSA